MIRLFRTGRKNQPSYKVVVTEKTNAPARGRFVEEVGFYNPLTKDRKFNAERITYWISVGAKLSDTVHNMLVKAGVIKGEIIPKHKKAKKKEGEEEATVPASTEVKEEGSEVKAEGAPATEEKKEESVAPQEEKPAEPETKEEPTPEFETEKEPPVEEKEESKDSEEPPKEEPKEEKTE